MDREVYIRIQLFLLDILQNQLYKKKTFKFTKLKTVLNWFELYFHCFKKMYNISIFKAAIPPHYWFFLIHPYTVIPMLLSCLVKYNEIQLFNVRYSIIYHDQLKHNQHNLLICHLKKQYHSMIDSYTPSHILFV